MKGKAVVTGAAGFIGSHLCERLLDEGFEVLAVDAFTDYYSPERKRRHIAACAGRPGFTLAEENLATCDVARLIDGARCVFHLAAQAGVRKSWGKEFARYIESNILSTQRLLEALRENPSIPLIHSSSSSVYGETRMLPMREDHPTVPLSPYGATKLAGEHLCELYRLNYGITYRALRYFTVYGPRQRPDMAFSRFINASFAGKAIDVYGDGRQTRDFTYVADAVDANMRALRYEGPMTVFNIGGGSRAALLDVLDVLGRELGGRLEVRFVDRAKGDVTDTWADTSRARDALGFKPRVSLEEGIRNEIAWYREYMKSSEGGGLSS
ncbi:MAG: GDP-mannose 4,6-dehydratase [Candidatus Krumholzibacteria bacterium]|nr:GDP-mannose 4,6-dehydratase [Candidatus Krumholzibacteria bacterium]